MNIHQTLTDVGSVNEQGQTVLCRMTEAVYRFSHHPDREGLDIAESNLHYFVFVVDYRNLICKPITLGDLVPTNEKGEVLERPCEYDKFLLTKEVGAINDKGVGWTEDEIWNGIPKKCREYEAAEKRVLFDEWDVEYLNDNGVVLTNGSYNVAFDKRQVSIVDSDFYVVDNIKSLEDFPNNGIELILKKR